MRAEPVPLAAPSPLASAVCCQSAVRGGDACACAHLTSHACNPRAGRAANDDFVNKHGWFAGFGSLSTWLCIAWQGLGGILVAVTIKYADNILRGFAQGLALIVGAIGSAVLFDFHLTMLFSAGVGFVIGVFLVILSIFIYGSSAQTPQELCEALGGVCPTALGGDFTPATTAQAEGDLETQSHDSSAGESIAMRPPRPTSPHLASPHRSQPHRSACPHARPTGLLASEERDPAIGTPELCPSPSPARMASSAEKISKAIEGGD